MLTPQIPTLLALLGTVLMAIVIFAPMPLSAPAPRQAPPAPVSVPRFDEYVSDPDEAYSPLPFDALAHVEDAAPSARAVRAVPRWPAMIDPSAAHCDAAARIALIDALTRVPGAWADAIVRRALDEEEDDDVRAAILAGKGGVVS